MSLSQVISDLKKSEIYSLVFDGKPLGFRVKLYDVDIRQFKYYDFNIETIGENAELKDYINSNYKNFKKLSLTKQPDGNYLTQDEIDGSAIVENFKDTNQAYELISKVMKIDGVRDQI